MNEANLIPFNKMNTDKQKELSKRGGIASGLARLKRKALKESLSMLLKEIPPLEVQNQVKSFLDNETTKGFDINNQTAVCVALIQSALKGNTKAFEIIRDTVYGKPSTKTNEPQDNKIVVIEHIV